MLPYDTDLLGERGDPTPLDAVRSLTASGRDQRLDALIVDAHAIIDEALAAHLDGRELVAKVVLFSGGADSLTLTHLLRDEADYAGHANTTIGVEETREFVRQTCKNWNLPLLERTAPTSYRDLVIERGFPGPAMHYKMYQRLKERPLEQIRRELVTDPRRQRVLFLAGRRRSESQRRQHIPIFERRGSTIWASPLAMWTRLDLAWYRRRHRLEENPVSQNLHMSGECLCGAFAKPNELDKIGFFYPQTAQELRSLEQDATDAGHRPPFNKWGHGGGKPSDMSGTLCGTCTLFDGCGV